MSKEVLVVLSDDKIRQKMAGYKANYQRRINSAKTQKERVELEKNFSSWISEKENELNSMNKKAIQQRAGRLSWITRMINAEISGDAEKISKFSITFSNSKKNKKESTGKRLTKNEIVKIHNDLNKNENTSGKNNKKSYRCAMSLNNIK